MRSAIRVAPRQAIACRVGVAVLSLLVAGCSSKQASYDPPTWVAGPRQPPAPVVAQTDYRPEPGDPIKEAPLEPLRRRAPEPDDPSEPFSRNYGTVRPGEARPAPARISSPGKAISGD